MSADNLPSLSLPPSLPPFSFPQMKIEAVSTESYVTIGTLQAEKTELLHVRDTMSKYIREIEQLNDNLERGKRSVWRRQAEVEGGGRWVGWQ